MALLLQATPSAWKILLSFTVYVTILAEATVAQKNIWLFYAICDKELGHSRHFWLVKAGQALLVLITTRLTALYLHELVPGLQHCICSVTDMTNKKHLKDPNAKPSSIFALLYLLLCFFLLDRSKCLLWKWPINSVSYARKSCWHFLLCTACSEIHERSLGLHCFWMPQATVIVTGSPNVMMKELSCWHKNTNCTSHVTCRWILARRVSVIIDNTANDIHWLLRNSKTLVSKLERSGLQKKSMPAFF